MTKLIVQFHTICAVPYIKILNFNHSDRNKTNMSDSIISCNVNDLFNFSTIVLKSLKISAKFGESPKIGRMVSINLTYYIRMQPRRVIFFRI